MATYKGVNKTIIDAATAAHTVDPGLAGGNVKVMVDTYEASALAVADIVEMGKDLPINSRVLAVLLEFDALGGSITLDVGDAEDPNRYLNAVDASSAGSQLSNLVDGVEYHVDNTTASTPDTQVNVTIGGSGTATGTIKLVVLYTHE